MMYDFCSFHCVAILRESSTNVAQRQPLAMWGRTFVETAFFGSNSEQKLAQMLLESLSPSDKFL